MGTVYRAQDTRTNRLVAFKVLGAKTDTLEIPEGTGDSRPTAADHAHSDRGRRFVIEAQVLAQLAHPAIVGYVSHGFTDEGLPYLAMSWIDGQTLAARLEHGALGILEAMQLAQRLAHALGSAHRAGILHRDLKPSNVMLPGGDLRKAMLIDFGVAHTSQSAPGADEGLLLGTLGYLAPEQARGDATLDPRVDVFGLGCLLYRLITGRLPFEGNDAATALQHMMRNGAPRADLWADALPAGLVDLLSRMLAVDPSDRPRDADVVAQDLDQLLLHEQLTGEEAAQSVLGTFERRLITVVLAERTEPSSDIATPMVPGESEPPTLADASAVQWIRSIRIVAKPFGVSLRPLGGTQVALIAGQETSARAERETAVQLALQLRRSRLVSAVHVEVVALRSGGAFVIEPLSALGLKQTSGPVLLALMEAQAVQQALAPRTRRVLRAASLCSASFHRDELLTLLGHTEAPTLDQSLDDLVGSGFLLLQHRSYAFADDLVRTAVRLTLTSRDSALGERLLHLRVGRAAQPLITATPRSSSVQLH
jgi:serine/threonine protein kinase